jgi:hypothetical protein
LDYPQCREVPFSALYAVLIELRSAFDGLQPSFAPFDPELVGGGKACGRVVENAELDLGLPVIDREQSRSAPWAKATALQRGCLAGIAEAIPRPDGIKSEGRPAFLPAIRAMANPYSQRFAMNR